MTGMDSVLVQRVGRDARVVHGAIGSPVLAAWLREQGYRNYVGLVEPEGLAGSERLGLGSSGVPYREPRQLERNNAELLVLEGRATAVLATRASLSHARFLLVPAALRLVPALVARRAARNLRFAGRVSAPGEDGSARRLWLFEIAHRSKVRPRLYLDPALGVAALFEELARREARYAVLRWWERLPEVDPGGDVDLLVEDDDLVLLQEVLDGRAGTLPLDVYTAAGSRGHEFRGACYYPPHLARALLARSAPNARGIRIPASEDAWLSLAFHAVYHKGPSSGLPSVHVDGTGRPAKHDYAGALGVMGAPHGFAPELTLEGLDDFLAERGWRPPRDTLRKWSRKNPYLRARYFSSARSHEEPGVTVFVVRRHALEHGMLEEVAAEIRREGFEIVRTAELPAAAGERLRCHTRGGNWEKGDFPADGGPPAVCLVAFDPRPLRLRRRYRHRYPDMDDGRIVSKRRIRDRINARYPEPLRSNFLHSSDNSEEAWEYVRLALPESEAALRTAIDALRAR